MGRLLNWTKTGGPPLEVNWFSPSLLLALLCQEAARRLRTAYNAHSLKLRQFQLLGLLPNHGAMSQRELGETVGVDPCILVTLLNPLGADGFVSRERGPVDRRRHVVMLTTAGKRHFGSATRAQGEGEDALFAGLDGDQRQQLSAVLVALSDSLASGHERQCPPLETAEDYRDCRWPHKPFQTFLLLRLPWERRGAYKQD